MDCVQEKNELVLCSLAFLASEQAKRSSKETQDANGLCITNHRASSDEELKLLGLITCQSVSSAEIEKNDTIACNWCDSAFQLKDGVKDIYGSKKRAKGSNEPDSSSAKRQPKRYFQVDLDKLEASELTKDPDESWKTLSEVDSSVEDDVLLDEFYKNAQEQLFFPLSVDNYYMSVAILAQLVHPKKTEVPVIGVCIVSNESSCVVGIASSASDGSEKCAEMKALMNVREHCRVDLTKCALYTTGYPCFSCTEAVLKAGIRIIVYNGNDDSKKNDRVEKLVHKEKVCFQKYKCFIKDKKMFIIEPSDEPKVYIQYEKKGPIPQPQTETPAANVEVLPTYQDFFMAMAFLAATRTKDNKYHVGACLVTSYPHRIVSMGYNGMPDGRGFRDSHMDWGDDQSPYICHAELNAIIAAFRREADVSTCTLYVTHTPCADCSKLIVQSGIKNIVFAKYYDEGKDAYKLLGQLPDMTVTRYECKSGCEEMTIDLKTLKVQKEKSTRICLQFDDKKFKIEKGRRMINLPHDDYFMAIAVLATSRCREQITDKAGACLVYSEPCRPISIGYSGYPVGYKPTKDDDTTCCAESNAILSAFRYHADLTNSTLYTTGYPCYKCAQMIVQSGIKTVVYNDDKNRPEPKADGSVAEKNAHAADKIFFYGKVAMINYKEIKEEKVDKITIDLKAFIAVDPKEQPKPKSNNPDREQLLYNLAMEMSKDVVAGKKGELKKFQEYAKKKYKNICEDVSGVVKKKLEEEFYKYETATP